MRRRIPPVLHMMTAALIAACGGEQATDPGSRLPVPTSLQAAGGNSQSAVVASALPQPLQAKVLDQNGAGLAGVGVQWAVSDGGGSVSAASTTTGTDGTAQVTWTLGTRAGSHTVTATVSGLSPASFTATATAGALVSLSATVDSLRFSALGDTVRVQTRAIDQYGNEIPSLTLQWTSTDTAVATVANAGVVRARRNGVAQVTLGTQSKADTVRVRVQQEVATVAIAPRADTINALGFAKTLAAAVKDRNGFAVEGASAAWASLDTAVASVSAAGRVEGRTRGTARVVASSASKADTVPVLVRQVVASLAFVSPAATLSVSDSARFSVGAADSNRVTVPDPAITWATSAAAVATASATGWVRGVAPGPVAVTAAAATASASTSLTVNARVAPVVSSITPATLSPGDTAVFTGQGFSPVTAGNTVVIAGVTGTVTQASGQQLRVALPARNAFACEPTRSVVVTVAVPGATATTAKTLSVPRRHELARGQSTLLSGQDSWCNELSVTGGRYNVVVFNVSTDVSKTEAFSLRGAAVAWGASRSISPMSLDGTPATAAQAPDQAAQDPEARHWAAHTRIMEANRELVRRLGPPRLPSGPPLSRAAAAPKVGDTLGLKFPINFSCTESHPLRARVVYSGTTAVVLEDVAAPLAGTMDEKYRAIGQDYEGVMHPLILQNFGNPLARDATLGGVGRLLMLFTSRVNDLGYASGFVSYSDFYPTTQCGTSNQAPVFYAIIPTSSATGRTFGTTEYWQWYIPTAVMHEVKHVAAIAEQFARSPSNFVPEEDWLEEGTAQVASELYARQVFGYAQRGNVGYEKSVWCEYNCAGKHYAMFHQFKRLSEFTWWAWYYSLIGSAYPGDGTIYGSSWAFIRWAIDNYASSESQALKALVDEPNLRGTANLSARTGRSFEDLLGRFALSTLNEYYMTATAADLNHPSWDLKDVFAGMRRDFPAVVPATFPLRAWGWMQFGNFDVSLSILRGGAFALFIIDGLQVERQLLELKGEAGASPASSLRVAIFRDL